MLISFQAVPFSPLPVLWLSCLVFLFPDLLVDVHFPKVKVTLTEGCRSCRGFMSLARVWDGFQMLELHAAFFLLYS